MPPSLSVVEKYELAVNISNLLDEQHVVGSARRITTSRGAEITAKFDYNVGTPPRHLHDKQYVADGSDQQHAATPPELSIVAYMHVIGGLQPPGPFCPAPSHSPAILFEQLNNNSAIFVHILAISVCKAACSAVVPVGS